MKEKWDERYRQKEFAYGEQPNAFLKQELDKLLPGTILFPAEGEGRNAIYAATLGWTVYAFDQSVEGKKKALQLAAKYQVKITYETDAFQSLTYQASQFDALALIYAHFPADQKSGYHRKLTTYLRTGGIIIFEAFGKKHLDYVAKNPKVGGPKDAEMLFSIEEIRDDFNNFEVIALVEQEIELREGSFHNGTGSVIRFVGRKQ